MIRKTAPEGTQAVIRAIHLLKAFSRERHEQNLAELSTTVGLTKTTAHRLLTALESEDLVVRNPATKTFRLGPAIIALGSQALVNNDLRAVVEPELRMLAERSGETATLEVPMEGSMLIVAEVMGSHLVTVTAELGTRWPMHATSTGKAFLAAISEEQRLELLTPPLHKYTPSTIVDVEELERELEQVRKHGYATANEEIEVGASAVGTVLRNSRGTPVGAISFGGPTSRFTPTRVRSLAQDLLATAARLAPSLHSME
ncbi:MAG: IclR family transcriptional regulator [bacterium]|nr:IclR family transcriptional regulator [bacterium]